REHPFVRRGCGWRAVRPIPERHRLSARQGQLSSPEALLLVLVASPWGWIAFCSRRAAKPRRRNEEPPVSHVAPGAFLSAGGIEFVRSVVVTCDDGIRFPCPHRAVPGSGAPERSLGARLRPATSQPVR